MSSDPRQPSLAPWMTHQWHPRCPELGGTCSGLSHLTCPHCQDQPWGGAAETPGRSPEEARCGDWTAGAWGTRGVWRGTWWQRLCERVSAWARVFVQAGAGQAWTPLLGSDLELGPPAVASLPEVLPAPWCMGPASQTGCWVGRLGRSSSRPCPRGPWVVGKAHPHPPPRPPGAPPGVGGSSWGSTEGGRWVARVAAAIKVRCGHSPESQARLCRATRASSPNPEAGACRAQGHRAASFQRLGWKSCVGQGCTEGRSRDTAGGVQLQARLADLERDALEGRRVTPGGSWRPGPAGWACSPSPALWPLHSPRAKL